MLKQKVNDTGENRDEEEGPKPKNVREAPRRVKTYKLTKQRPVLVPQKRSQPSEKSSVSKIDHKNMS